VTEVPSGVQGRSPGGGLGAKPPEADGIVLNKDTQTLFPVYVDINTNRAVLFPAELKFLRFKIFFTTSIVQILGLLRFLLVVQLMMQIEFCICNFEHDYLDG